MNYSTNLVWETEGYRGAAERGWLGEEQQYIELQRQEDEYNQYLLEKEHYDNLKERKDMKEITEEDLVAIEKLCGSVQFEQWEPEEFIRKHCLNMISELRRLKGLTNKNVCCQVNTNDCKNDSCCESQNQSCGNNCNSCVNCPCKED